MWLRIFPMLGQEECVVCFKVVFSCEQVTHGPWQESGRHLPAVHGSLGDRLWRGFEVSSSVVIYILMDVVPILRFGELFF